jgi:hypothetical protein
LTVLPAKIEDFAHSKDPIDLPGRQSDDLAHLPDRMDLARGTSDLVRRLTGRRRAVDAVDAGAARNGSESGSCGELACAPSERLAPWRWILLV